MSTPGVAGVRSEGSREEVPIPGELMSVNLFNLVERLHETEDKAVRRRRGLGHAVRVLAKEAYSVLRVVKEKFNLHALYFMSDAQAVAVAAFYASSMHNVKSRLEKMLLEFNEAARKITGLADARVYSLAFFAEPHGTRALLHIELPPNQPYVINFCINLADEEVDISLDKVEKGEQIYVKGVHVHSGWVSEITKAAAWQKRLELLSIIPPTVELINLLIELLEKLDEAVKILTVTSLYP